MFKQRFITAAILILVPAVVVIAWHFSVPLERMDNVSRQRMDNQSLVKDILSAGGRVNFTDERVGSDYVQITHIEIGRFINPPGRPAAENDRVIEFVDLETKELPDGLLQRIAQLGSLKALTVSPAIDTSPACREFRRQRPDVRIGVKWRPDDMPIRWLRTKAEFEATLAQGSILFYVDAKYDLVDGGSTRREAISKWMNSRIGKDALDCVGIDICDSDVDAVEAVCAWSELHALPKMPIGVLLWVKDEIPCQHLSVTSQFTSDQFETITQKFVAQ